MSEWISVDDKLPDDSYPVLTYSELLGRAINSYFNSERKWESEEYNGQDQITDWAPLLEPPKDKTP
jgi:hypothetical protein